MYIKNLFFKKGFYGHLVYVQEKQLLISNLCKVESGGGSDATAGAGDQGDLVLHGNNSFSSECGFKSVSKRWEMCSFFGGGRRSRPCLFVQTKEGVHLHIFSVTGYGKIVYVCLASSDRRSNRAIYFPDLFMDSSLIWVTLIRDGSNPFDVTQRSCSLYFDLKCSNCVRSKILWFRRNREVE